MRLRTPATLAGHCDHEGEKELNIHKVGPTQVDNKGTACAQGCLQLQWVIVIAKTKENYAQGGSK